VDHQPSLSYVLVLDKPAGMTSAAAVEAVKRRLAARRAGHGGTLDPIATGVLPICLDEATKLAAYLLADDKEYVAELVLGIETDTLDRTGAVTAQRDASGVTREALVAALAARTGEHDQLPPMYSAVKQQGRRLYQRARAGEQVDRVPRRVRIDRLELLAWAPPRATIAVACSKGTYVRSLVGDLGRDLGPGAHLAELRRTRSGRFTLEHAHQLDALDRPRFVTMIEATALPVVAVPDALLHRVRSGVQQVAEKLAGLPSDGTQFQLVSGGDRLVAIAHVERGKVIYDRVFRALPAA
jgi:tRNA pseudouridine55 synthase